VQKPTLRATVSVSFRNRLQHNDAGFGGRRPSPSGRLYADS
jgi:hypothetical protein